jgi:hypothetical protein
MNPNDVILASRMSTLQHGRCAGGSVLQFSDLSGPMQDQLVMLARRVSFLAAVHGVEADPDVVLTNLLHAARVDRSETLPA